MPKKQRKHPGGAACLFCNTWLEEEVSLGKIMRHKSFSVHYFCMLFSSGLVQNGRDDQGLLGFMPRDVLGESRRGSRLKCCYCKKTGATIGCTVGHCRRNFHLPCGIQNDSLHQFFDTFRSFCSDHRPRQVISTSDRLSFHGTAKTTCPICLLSVEARTSNHTLRAPCCKNSWFHRRCLQMQALNAGYFFKCPLCNNKEIFQSEMLTYGIYIPEQDASWELDENAFQELLFRHNTCDADSCKCPMGKNYHKRGGPWKLLLCGTCGSQGIHVQCASVKNNWVCTDCEKVGTRVEAKDSNPTMPCSSNERTGDAHNQQTNSSEKKAQESANMTTAADGLDETTVRISNVEIDEIVDVEETDELSPFDESFSDSFNQHSNSEFDGPAFANESYSSPKDASNSNNQFHSDTDSLGDDKSEEDIEIIGVSTPTRNRALRNHHTTLNRCNRPKLEEGDTVKQSGEAPALPVIECTYSLDPSYALRPSRPKVEVKKEAEDQTLKPHAYARKRISELRQTTLSPFVRKRAKHEPVEVIDLTEPAEFESSSKKNASVNNFKVEPSTRRPVTHRESCLSSRECSSSSSSLSSRNLFGKSADKKDCKIECYLTEWAKLSVKIKLKQKQS